MINKDYTRVTDVLKPFSGLLNVPEEILKRAAERGTLAHQWIDADIKKLGLHDVLSAEQGYITSYTNWKQDKELITTSRLYDKELQITGLPDAFYKMEGGAYCLIDFKTSAPKKGKVLEKYKKIWGMQLCAYANMARTSGIEVNAIQIINLPKSGDEAIVYDLTEGALTYWILFQSCLKCYREFFEGKPDDSDWEWL